MLNKIRGSLAVLMAAAVSGAMSAATGGFSHDAPPRRRGKGQIGRGNYCNNGGVGHPHIGHQECERRCRQNGRDPATAYQGDSK